MQLLDTQAQLDDLVTELHAKAPAAIAIDLEADNLHRYEEKLCLVQLFDGTDFHLIDPLAIDDFTGFIDFINSTRLWMHGADYDMSLFLGEWGVLPDTIWDTQIGARLIGHTKFGYAGLVEHYHDVKLSKSSQREDWRQRPLPHKMLEYALNDVRYLLQIADSIESTLKEKGRHQWFIESINNAKTKALSRNVPRVDPWKINGSGKLQPHGLHYLRALWTWRDAEAQKWDRPAFMVMGNKQIIAWAEQLAKGQRIHTPKHLRPDRQNRLFKALDAARDAPEADWPQKPRNPRHRWTEEEEAHLDAIIAHRNKNAEELGIDPSLIAARATLEALATNRDLPDPLMDWQKSLLP